MQEKLKPAGVQTLAVVNTTLDRARLYFKYRPTPIVLAADPEASTHRLFGVPAFEVGEVSDWPRRGTSEEVGAVRVNPTGERAAAAPPPPPRRARGGGGGGGGGRAGGGARGGGGPRAPPPPRAAGRPPPPGGGPAGS